MSQESKPEPFVLGGGNAEQAAVCALEEMKKPVEERICNGCTLTLKECDCKRYLIDKEEVRVVKQCIRCGLHPRRCNCYKHAARVAPQGARCVGARLETSATPEEKAAEIEERKRKRAELDLLVSREDALSQVGDAIEDAADKLDQILQLVKTEDIEEPQEFDVNRALEIVWEMNDKVGECIFSVRNAIKRLRKEL